MLMICTDSAISKATVSWISVKWNVLHFQVLSNLHFHLGFFEGENGFSVMVKYVCTYFIYLQGHFMILLWLSFYSHAYFSNSFRTILELGIYVLRLSDEKFANVQTWHRDVGLCAELLSVTADLSYSTLKQRCTADGSLSTSPKSVHCICQGTGMFVSS